ncbi:Mitogen-activated protein kinase kinase kinase kinase 1 [Camelus dromedarius]|uniref:Mitogen-activated protein kinase kinase kinase kinase 1 n=1 Tax=Camelus dromedarius TaxID=9838 RepID=A0A5N4DUL6_CAMDR|nr:Mitogen-activated protein kinase kinase kinase kinase 1 [Camelus dromedarius]
MEPADCQLPLYKARDKVTGDLGALKMVIEMQPDDRFLHFRRKSSSLKTCRHANSWPTMGVSLACRGSDLHGILWGWFSQGYLPGTGLSTLTEEDTRDIKVIWGQKK